MSDPLEAYKRKRIPVRDEQEQLVHLLISSTTHSSIILLSNSVLAVATVLVGQVLAKDTSTCYTTFTNKPPGYAPQTKWSTHYSRSKMSL